MPCLKTDSNPVDTIDPPLTKEVPIEVDDISSLGSKP